MERSRHLEELLRTLNRDFEAGQFGPVLNEIEAEEGAGPLTGRLLNLKGLCLAELGRHPEAISAFEAGIQTSYDRAELHVNLAVALVAESSFGRAMAEFEEGIRLDPTSVDGHLGYGRLLTRFRRWSAAREALDHAFDLDPTDERVQWARGELFDGLADIEASVGVWRWFEEHRPTPESARRLAQNLRTAGDPGAVEAFERCAQRDPSALDCLESAAELRLTAGDFAGCRALLEERALELSEASYHNLCLALQGATDPTALDGLVAVRAPTLGPTWGVVALVRREAGATESALAATREGLKLSPQDDNLANLEAVLLYDLGRREEARTRWKAILERSPEDANAQRNLDELFPG